VGVGGWLITLVIGNVLVALGLMYHWVTSWADLPSALVALSITSFLGGVVIAGKLARLHGRREWAKAFGLLLTLVLLPVLPGALMIILRPGA